MKTTCAVCKKPLTRRRCVIAKSENSVCRGSCQGIYLRKLSASKIYKQDKSTYNKLIKLAEMREKSLQPLKVIGRESRK